MTGWASSTKVLTNTNTNHNYYVLWWLFMTETKCSYQPSERWAVCDAISLSCVTKCSSFRWLETTFCSKCQSWKVTKAHKPSPPYIYRFSFTWGPAKLPDQKLSKEAKDNILKLWYPLLINITKNRHENDLFGSWPIKWLFGSIIRPTWSQNFRALAQEMPDLYDF